MKRKEKGSKAPIKGGDGGDSEKGDRVSWGQEKRTPPWFEKGILAAMTREESHSPRKKGGGRSKDEKKKKKKRESWLTVEKRTTPLGGGGKTTF